LTKPNAKPLKLFFTRAQPALNVAPMQNQEPGHPNTPVRFP